MVRAGLSENMSEEIGAARRTRTGDLLITNCPEGHTEKEPEGKDS